MVSTSAFLDPFVLACPGAEAGREGLESFLRGLVEWQRLPSPCVTTYKLRRTAEVLVAAGSFPMFDAVRRSLRAFGVSYIEARDVVTIAESLLLNLPDAEDAIGMEVLLLECALDPAIGSNRPIALRLAVEELAATAALRRPESTDGQLLGYLLTRCVDALGVQVTGTLVDCEPTQPGLPRALAGTLLLCRTMDELHGQLDLPSSWCGATCDADREAILRIYVGSVAAENDGGRRTEWSVGERFLRSASEFGFDREPVKARRLLRAAAETIIGLAMADTHPLRIGAGPTAPQRQRPGRSQAAWRRDIDREYHLHYWGGGEGIELAAVVPHWDADIAE